MDHYALYELYISDWVHAVCRWVVSLPSNKLLVLPGQVLKMAELDCFFASTPFMHTVAGFKNSHLSWCRVGWGCVQWLLPSLHHFYQHIMYRGIVAASYVIVSSCYLIGQFHSVTPPHPQRVYHRLQYKVYINVCVYSNWAWQVRRFQCSCCSKTKGVGQWPVASWQSLRADAVCLWMCSKCWYFTPPPPVSGLYEREYQPARCTFIYQYCSLMPSECHDIVKGCQSATMASSMMSPVPTSYPVVSEIRKSGCPLLTLSQCNMVVFKTSIFFFYHRFCLCETQCSHMLMNNFV